MITPPDPGAAVRCGEQGVHLGLGEVGDHSPVGALGRDGEHALDHRGVFGMPVGGEAEQRSDGGEPGVAGADAGCACGLEVGEERPDQRRVEIVKAELVWRLAGALVGEAQQQTDRVAVGSHGVRAGVALADQPFGEERLQQRCERAHGRASVMVSSRSATSSSSSGTAVRYQ